MYRSPLPASIYGCARMTDGGLPFDTSHTAHVTRSATSLAKGYQPCQGWRRARTINFSPDDKLLASADFYAGGLLRRRGGRTRPRCPVRVDARSASKTQHEQLSTTRIQRFRSRWRSLGESNPCFSLERAAS